jgi:hypothetical protein
LVVARTGAAASAPPRPPSVVIPSEYYADLDLLLLTAADDRQRWEALIAGTREMIDRPGRLAEVGFLRPGQQDVLTGARIVDCFVDCARLLDEHQIPQLAEWLRELIGVLSAQQRLQHDCTEQICTALQSDNHKQALAAISDGAALLHAAATDTRSHLFSHFPPYSTAEPNYPVLLVTLAALGAEMRRNPLRKQINGAGGMAGSPELTLRRLFVRPGTGDAPASIPPAVPTQRTPACLTYFERVADGGASAILSA